MSLLGQSNEVPMPPGTDKLLFFITKIDMIRQNFGETSAAETNDPCALTACLSELSSFVSVSQADIQKLVMSTPAKSCELDPLPTWLLKLSHEQLIPIITALVNASLVECTMTKEMKTAVVRPLLKKVGLPLEMKNYRPVSNLAYVSKVIEKVIAEQLIHHIEVNNLHEPFQSAYKKYHSTETALTRVKNDIIRAITNKEVSFLILLDLSAAFDTVDHKILLNRLHDRMGITGDAHRWFCSYLSDRTQSVSVMGSRSDSVTLSCGVPQGSVLGPLLFGIYTSPLSDIISKHGVTYHLYADDTQLYMSFKPESQSSAETTANVLERCVEDIRVWMHANKLKLNGDKTEYLLIGNKHQKAKIIPPIIQIAGSPISTSQTARNLGVVFDDEFNMEAHVTALCKSISYQLFKIGEIPKYLTMENTATLVHSLITSRLDCANAVLYGLPEKQLDRLQ